MLNSFFNNNKTMTATVQTRTQTMTNGELGAITWTDGIEARCLFWRGAVADSILNEKIRADVYAVAIFRPSDVSVGDFPDTARLKIEDAAGNNIGYFSIVSPDNIGEQGKVLMVPLKKFDG